MYTMDPQAVPSRVNIIYDRFTKLGASVNITWSTDGAADNYTIGVTPPVMPAASDFTVIDANVLLMVAYNVNYFINITSHNCAGSISTIKQLIVGEW